MRIDRPSFSPRQIPNLWPAMSVEEQKCTDGDNACDSLQAGKQGSIILVYRGQAIATDCCHSIAAARDCLKILI